MTDTCIARYPYLGYDLGSKVGVFLVRVAASEKSARTGTCAIMFGGVIEGVVYIYRTLISHTDWSSR